MFRQTYKFLPSANYLQTTPSYRQLSLEQHTAEQLGLPFSILSASSDNTVPMQAKGPLS